jgi:hypothetical protein
MEQSSMGIALPMLTRNAMHRDVHYFHNTATPFATLITSGVHVCQDSIFNTPPTKIFRRKIKILLLFHIFAACVCVGVLYQNDHKIIEEVLAPTNYGSSQIL